MKYLLLIHNELAGLLDGLPAEQRDAYDRAHGALLADLAASGELVDSNELDIPTARLVRVDADGSVVVTDGPFTEGREITGGYYLVDVVDEARATAIAARLAEARYSPVELRLLMH